MDSFTVTIAIVQEVHNITLLVRGIVYKIDSYGSEAQLIRGRIESEYQFFNSFKSLFFNHADARSYYAPLPTHLKSEIRSISESLRSSLVVYGLIAMKHGINVVEPSTMKFSLFHEGTQTDAAEPDKPSFGIKFLENMFANLEHLRQSFDPVDWTLFDRDKILDMLDRYKTCTTRLHEVVALLLLLTRQAGFFENWDMATNPIGTILGLSQVAERQKRLDGEPDASLTPLRGIIKGESLQRPLHQYQMVEYDESLTTGRIQVILEERLFDMQGGIHLGSSIADRRNKELQPVRALAWLLQGSATKEASQVDAKGLKSMYTLECRGYIDRSAENYAILVYNVPIRDSPASKMMTLHEFIVGIMQSESGQRKPDSLSKPALGNRYFLAYALAMTLFSIHSSGWVHRNIRSRCVLIFPDPDQTARIVPYLVGWGAARSQEKEQTSAPRKHYQDKDLESNLYLHPDQLSNSTAPFENKHDIYALGVVLLEIGLWKTMSVNFAKAISRVGGHAALPAVTAIVSQLYELARGDELKQEMGVEYANVVQRCLATDFDAEDDDEMRTILMSRFRGLVVERLSLGLSL